MNTIALAKCALDVHHHGMPWWGELIFYFVIGVLILLAIGFGCLIDTPAFLHSLSDSETAVLMVAVVLFWSIGITVGILWCLWKAPRVLYTGVRDLRARVRRADPQVPPARVEKP